MSACVHPCVFVYYAFSCSIEWFIMFLCTSVGKCGQNVLSVIYGGQRVGVCLPTGECV